MEINTTTIQEPAVFLNSIEDHNARGFILLAFPDCAWVHEYALEGEKARTLGARQFASYRQAQRYVKQTTGAEAYAYDIESDMPRGRHGRAIFNALRRHFDLS